MVSEFEDADTQVLGISCDSRFSHRAWAAHLGGLSYPLLTDFWPHGEASRKYCVLHGDGAPDRKAFAVDKQGVIRHIFGAPREEPRTKEQMHEALLSIAGTPVLA